MVTRSGLCPTVTTACLKNALALDDAHLREVLDVAVQGSGAFRRFKDVLHRYPAAQAQWFKFKAECQQQRMLDWFATEGLEPEFE